MTPRIRFFLAGAIAFGAACAQPVRAAIPVLTSTNAWSLASGESLERLTFVLAPEITMAGDALNDTFWVSQGALHLPGTFHNDVWGLAEHASLSGTFHDHARIIARSLVIDGTISNGLWALGMSLASTTNSLMRGDHLILVDTLSLLGTIEGNLYARGRQITLGGYITGDVYLYGDDIILRPGTTILGRLHYVTTGQPIVLDSKSTVGGEMRKINLTSPDTTTSVTPLYWLFFWYITALVAGIPFIMLFPRFTGHAVQALRGNMFKSGLAGLAGLLLTPVLIVMIFITMIGIPLALAAGAGYGLLIYLGKFPVALAIGTALLQRRDQVSLSLALLALVIGLFLYYSLALIPGVGSSLQMAASAFGFGSLLLALAAGRGQVGAETKSKEPKAQA